MSAPLVIPRARFWDADGAPLAFGKLYTYGAGTSTPKTTFVAAEGAENENPVTLDANGEADIWLSGAYKLTLTDAADVEQWTVDNVKEQLTAPAGVFTLVNSSPTVVDATSFSLAGDQTNYFFLNQRVKFTTSTTTVYARVTSAVYALGVTTVVLSNGVINVGVPSGVYAGLGDLGLPIDARHVAYGTTQTVEDAIGERLSKVDGGAVNGPVTFNKALNFGQTVELEAAEVMDLTLVEGVLVDLTDPGGGPLTITSFGTPTAGAVLLVRAGFGFTIDCSSNIQFGAADEFAVSEGDCFWIIGVTHDASDFWQVMPMTYQIATPTEVLELATGVALTPDNVRYSPHVIAGSAAFSFADGDYSDYGEFNVEGISDIGVGDYEIVFSTLPVTDPADYRIQAVVANSADGVVLIGEADGFGGYVPLGYGIRTLDTAGAPVDSSNVAVIMTWTILTGGIPL